MVDPAGAEPGLRDGEPEPLLADQVGDGDPDVLEQQLGVATVLVVVVAEDRHRPHHGQARGVAGDQDHRLLPVPVGARVGLAHHDEDLALGVHGAGDPPLAPVDDVLVTVADDGGLDVRRVGRRHVGLGHRERRADRPLEKRRQPPLLLLGAPEHREDLHVAGVRGRAVERGRREVSGPTGDLRERRVLQVRESRAVALPVRGRG